MGPSAFQKRLLAAVAGPALGAVFRAHRLARRAGGQAARALPDNEVRRVLAVRLDAIGDLLLSEPALALLRRRFPLAEIDLVANPDSAAVLRGNPNVDHVMGYRAPWHAAWRGGEVDWGREAARFWGVTRALRARRYEVGFELRGDFRDILFLAAATPGTLSGSGVRGGGSLLDCDVRPPQDAHQVAIAAAIAAAGGPNPAALPRPAVYLTEAERSRAADLVPPGSGVWIALHLGAGFQSKCLPIEKFAALAQALARSDASRRFLVVGSAAEAPLAAQLTSLTGLPVVPLVGQLSLLETAAVLDRCRLFIGNDSAPMHLAAATGTPVVTFFGPSEPWKFHPYGVPYHLLEVDLECRPCDYVHCIWQGDLRFQCMTRQDTAAIVAAAEELLGRV